MKTKLALLALLLVTGLALAATYTYKCPKCGNIQTFDRPSPGVKCPRDGWIMTPQ
jgi:predicted nucleic acid-binding Zn ribbon protein